VQMPVNLVSAAVLPAHGLHFDLSAELCVPSAHGLHFFAVSTSSAPKVVLLLNVPSAHGAHTAAPCSDMVAR
jgi:hypothetical protein